MIEVVESLVHLIEGWKYVVNCVCRVAFCDSCDNRGLVVFSEELLEGVGISSSWRTEKL